MHHIRQKSYLLCRGKAPVSLHRLTERRAFSSRACIGTNQPTKIMNTMTAQVTSSPDQALPIKEALAEKPHIAEPAVPFLPRPLGIDDQRVALGLKALNQDVPRDSAEAEKLRKKRYQRAVTKTHWTDYHKLRKTGGKSWTAPPTLIREDMALYFPGMNCIRLSDSETLHSGSFWRDKITLVSILNTQISLEHCKSFYEPILERHARHSKLQHIQINHQENVVKSWLLRLAMSSMRRSVAKDKHETFFLSHEDLEDIEDEFGYVNKHVGYTYIVDQNAKIRWAGCAFATDQEIKSGVESMGVLLTRS